MNVTILVLGFLFGAALQYARLNRYNVISGMATLENFAVAKAIAVAIGTGVIIIAIEIGLGFATYHIKPILLGGIAIGGIIFGTGMAILGYCPGTLPVSLGEGSVDALIGIIGASTAYPYVADLVTGTTQNSYFPKVQGPGQWEVLFLTGAFVSGIVISLFRKEFKITLIYGNWEKYKGKSVSKRLIWSFIGGFILIIGARMAGGCTSGHVLSGGMQLAVSSLVFAVFVFGGLLITGKYFYKYKI